MTAEDFSFARLHWVAEGTGYEIASRAEQVPTTKSEAVSAF